MTSNYQPEVFASNALKDGIENKPTEVRRRTSEKTPLAHGNGNSQPSSTQFNGGAYVSKIVNQLPGQTSLQPSGEGLASDGEPDPKKELKKLRLVLHKHNSQIQALHDLFRLLEQKLAALFSDKKLADMAATASQETLEDSAAVSTLARTFLDTTGINPQPFLRNIELIDCLLKTLSSSPPISPTPAERPDTPMSATKLAFAPAQTASALEPVPIEAVTERILVEPLPQVVMAKSPESTKQVAVQSLPLQADPALVSRICSLEAINRELEFMMQNQEQEIRRVKTQMRHLQAIYEQSERQKQELLTQHQNKFEMIRRNYGRNADVSTDVIHLLAKICQLEKKLRERELEANRDRDQQVANTKELYKLFEQLKSDKLNHSKIKPQHA